jgi:1-pyrroline-5-carboxylate dehydrogenase
MANAIYRIPEPKNEPIKTYAPGSIEKKLIKDKLTELKSKQIEIPLIIGGKQVKTGNTAECRMPHNHSQLLGTYHKAGEKEIQMAVESALEAKKKWSAMDWHDRASIFLKAADLMAGPYRYELNAACMLDQSKTVFQAEIDSACELIDFLRFNPYYMQKIYEQQPNSVYGQWNRLEYRPLEGFIFAVTPFNFASIAGNLPTAPALMGNVVLWKPASSTVYIAYYIMKVLMEAGLPDGVINFIPAPGSAVGNIILKNPNLAGVHFTGSSAVFQGIWKTIGENIRDYKTYPRIVGETGGKDFIFAHKSADPTAVAVGLTRAAFEYQGQKCSACSRAYLPDNISDKVIDLLKKFTGEIKMGDVEDFTNYLNAVIDKNAFSSIVEYIEFAKKSDDAEIVIGGKYDDSKGYFIEPTVIVAKKPDFKTMCEEIFGPVLTIYIYPHDEYEKYLKVCDHTSPYALTGSIFAKDKQAVIAAEKILENAAGNFYLNDKCTAAVVGQQPFGGSRASGTNDKAGSFLNLIRWTSPRTIKETFVSPPDYKYPFMQEK